MTINNDDDSKDHRLSATRTSPRYRISPKCPKLNSTGCTAPAQPGLGSGPVSTASTAPLAGRAARVTSVWTVYVFTSGNQASIILWKT